MKKMNSLFLLGLLGFGNLTSYSSDCLIYRAKQPSSNTGTSDLAALADSILIKKGYRIKDRKSSDVKLPTDFSVVKENLFAFKMEFYTSKEGIYDDIYNTCNVTVELKNYNDEIVYRKPIKERGRFLPNTIVYEIERYDHPICRRAVRKSLKKLKNCK